MAYIKALQSGNFSDTSTWVGGIVPGEGDIACSGPYRITIDIAEPLAILSPTSIDWTTAGGTALLETHTGGFTIQADLTTTISEFRYGFFKSLAVNNTNAQLVFRNGNLSIGILRYVEEPTVGNSRSAIYVEHLTLTDVTLNIGTIITRGGISTTTGYSLAVDIKNLLNVPNATFTFGEIKPETGSTLMSRAVSSDTISALNLTVNINGKILHSNSFQSFSIISSNNINSIGYINEKIQGNGTSISYGIYLANFREVYITNGFTNTSTVNNKAIDLKDVREKVQIDGNLDFTGTSTYSFISISGTCDIILNGNIIKNSSGHTLFNTQLEMNYCSGTFTMNGDIEYGLSIDSTSSTPLISLPSRGMVLNMTQPFVHQGGGGQLLFSISSTSLYYYSITINGDIDYSNAMLYASSAKVVAYNSFLNTNGSYRAGPIVINGNITGHNGVIGSYNELSAVIVLSNSYLSAINSDFTINGNLFSGRKGGCISVTSANYTGKIIVNGEINGYSHTWNESTGSVYSIFAGNAEIIANKIVLAPNGSVPIQGKISFTPHSTGYIKVRDSDLIQRTLSITPTVVPNPSDVRIGVPVDETVGTLVVPQPATVLAGVTYDNSLVGTLNIPGGSTTDVYKSARYWRIYMTANNGDTYYSLQEVQIIGPNGTTVMTSPTTTVDASSFYNGGLYPADASKIVDGDESNGELGVWVSSGASPTEWISFDFVFPVGVSRFRILPQTYAPVTLSRSPNNYEIQWSDDNINWTTIKSITGDTSWTIDTYNVIEIDPISTQAVDITVQLDRIEDKVNLIPPISLNVEAIKNQTDKFFFTEVTEQEAIGDIHWDDTILLIHGNDGTIADEKTHTITNTSVSSTTTQAMDAGGSSMEFNQTNFLSIQHADYVLGTDDFTVEFWIYRDQVSQVYGSFFSNGYYGAYGGFNIRQSGGAEQIEVVIGWSNAVLYPTIPTPLNEWTHIAVTRETGLMRIFINGQFGGSIAASDNYTHDTLYVGTDGYYYASISNIVDLRVTKVCRYNASFTPPESLTHAPGTQPVIETHVKALTSSAGTGSNYDADFLEINNKLDALTTNISEIEVIANKFSFTPVYKEEDPFISGVAFMENYDSESIGSVYGFSPTIVSGVPYTTTLQKRLGTRSLACDGNVIINYGNITAMDVGANDFTIEFSALFNNTLAGNPTAFGGIMGKRENTNFAWTIYVSNGHLTFLTSAGSQPYSFTHSLELTQFEWTDVALSRTGNTLKFYINGQMESAEVPGMELNNVSSTFIIGALNIDTLDYFFHGYLDRIRFTEGTGRYNTIAPTSPPVEYLVTPIGTNQIDYYKVNSNPGEVDTTTIDRIEDRVLDLKARLRAIHFIMEQ